ncbi:hypothetical protein Tsubulata_013024 [Turnera subulata]|uniref:Uncharacterized protein n=1 Tax=Turnera subulata TaxID=218843 RepID=A0A9Q0G8E5_9ROSI|nr:hypothetical protein Tsubulata_013024 [Turnera subulata]
MVFIKINYCICIVGLFLHASLLLQLVPCSAFFLCGDDMSLPCDDPDNPWLSFPMEMEMVYKIVVHTRKIRVALERSGYKIMSVILDRNLPYLIENEALEKGDDKFAISSMWRNITIFVPRDEAFFKPRSLSPGKTKDFGPVVVNAYIEKGSPSLAIGTRFDMIYGVFVVQECPAAARNISDDEEEKDMLCVEEARIVDWEIYKDARVVVHGVDALFQRKLEPFWSSRLPECNMYYDNKV